MSTALSLTRSPSPSKRTPTTRLKLTEQRIANLVKPRVSVAYVYDTVTPSLAIRVASTGGRSFVVVKKINGTTQRITLGRYPGLRLDDARQAARTIAGEIAKGDNPVALRKAARARKTRLSDLWPAYLSHLKQRNRTWRRDKQRWETEVSPALGKKALAELSRSDCQGLIDRIGADRPIAANRVAAFLSALLNFAVRSDRLAVNPARGLIRFQETSRSRVLKSDELENLMKAIEVEREPWVSVFLMLMFTGARRGSVLSMRWEDIDLGAAIWTIPAEVAKNKTATPIPLTEPAVKLLQQQLERAANELWVFPSAIGAGHLVGLPKAWARVLRRAEIKNLRIHDIRRSVGTAMARTGASPHVIATGLGHRSIASARAYVRLAGEDARQALSDAVTSLTTASPRDVQARKEDTETTSRRSRHQ
ncbi:tyrosine-type recombinase/integrase [Bradyrhizobium sp. CCBAU 51753]|uniref:tyrosine-type recombinase/integrase n=1 Tax=Bradyrhizobium sp. CCBAU 51753 TaxID=1325100 RepID=UPI00188B0386|nr:tyrosine-type recombinase/integrase [Bradyrhizobium sp. CCBAU 51753]